IRRRCPLAPPKRCECWPQPPANHSEQPIVTTETRRHFADGLLELAQLARTVVEEMGPDLDRALEMVKETVAARGTLLFCGNGGRHSSSRIQCARWRCAPRAGRPLCDHPDAPHRPRAGAAPVHRTSHM